MKLNALLLAYVAISVPAAHSQTTSSVTTTNVPTTTSAISTINSTSSVDSCAATAMIIARDGGFEGFLSKREKKKKDKKPKATGSEENFCESEDDTSSGVLSVRSDSSIVVLGAALVVGVVALG